MKFKMHLFAIKFYNKSVCKERWHWKHVSRCFVKKKKKGSWVLHPSSYIFLFIQELNLEFHNLTAVTRAACLEREVNLNFKKASFVTGKSVRSNQLFHWPSVSSHEVSLTDAPWRKKLLGYRQPCSWKMWKQDNKTRTVNVRNPFRYS